MIKVPSEVIVNCEFVNNQSKYKSNLKKKMIQTTKKELSSDFPLLSHFKLLIGTAVTQAKEHFLRANLFLHLMIMEKLKHIKLLQVDGLQTAFPVSLHFPVEIFFLSNKHKLTSTHLVSLY